ncbi:MAG: PP2C family protein-serine/threonine phosphatase [Chloroherpetonaceae bacterium]
MNTSSKHSLSNFNEQLLKKYEFFFTLPLKVRATAATATFISSFMVLFLIHLMLNSLLTHENLIILYAFGAVISGLTFSMILFPSVRRFFWLTFPLSFLFGGYMGASSVMNTKAVESFDLLSFALAFTTLILIGASGSMWNYVIRSVVEEKSKLDAEIDLAQSIQKDFLPTLNIQTNVVELYGKGEFATEVGGDYYDAFWLNDGRLIVAVGDVSGHNVAAGLLMAITKAAFRAELRHFTTLENLMSELNKDICDNSRPKMFVSFACLLLDFRTKTFSTANAGHLPILFHQANHGNVCLLKPKAIALGLRHNAIFPIETYNFERGDRFLLFSDGVNETLNEDGEEFQIERVVEWFKTAPQSLSARELYETLSTTLASFRGNLPLRDDSTILAIKCR